MLHAGIGTDAPTYQVVTRTPGPGEVVDLGDIVLPNAGVITGTVLDDNGDPLPGALVRCADLPGALAAFFPIERFDPNGALLVREKNSPVRVVEMPAWVAKAVEELPFPRALTDSDEEGRLQRVAAGSDYRRRRRPTKPSTLSPAISSAVLPGSGTCMATQFDGVGLALLPVARS